MKTKKTPYQNLRNAGKVVIIGKFIAINAYIKKGDAEKAYDKRPYILNQQLTKYGTWKKQKLFSKIRQ
jgi:hypothetical protein